MNEKASRAVGFIESLVGELQGIELLDYHNRNHLAYDPKRCSEVKQEIISSIKKQVDELKSLV